MSAARRSVEWKGSKARKRKQVKKKETDPYALLGLSNERWTATEAQIRAAYRKVCLEAHPDKALVNVTDEAEKERIQVRRRRRRDGGGGMWDYGVGVAGVAVAKQQREGWVEGWDVGLGCGVYIHDELRKWGWGMGVGRGGCFHRSQEEAGVGQGVVVCSRMRCEQESHVCSAGPGVVVAHFGAGAVQHAAPVDCLPPSPLSLCVCTYHTWPLLLFSPRSLARSRTGPLQADPRRVRHSVGQGQAARVRLNRRVRRHAADPVRPQGLLQGARSARAPFPWGV